MFRTVVHYLLVRNLLLVAVQQVPERVGHLGDDGLAARAQLREVVCILDQRVEGADLERGNRKRLDLAVVLDGGGQRRDGVIFGKDLVREGDDDKFLGVRHRGGRSGSGRSHHRW